MTTKELLAESVEAAQLREREAFNLIAGDKADQIVLFGAGKLGRKVARALRNEGITPLAFADNNPELSGTNVEEIPVFSLEHCSDRWRNDAVFVVTIFHPTIDAGMKSRLEKLRELGCKTIMTFLPLAWKLNDVLPHYGADLPSRILAHAADLQTIGNLLYDEISKETYRQQLLWRLRGDFSQISPPVSDQYFPRDLITPNEREVFIDGGAFDGDTIRSIPWKLDSVWAFEPDPLNVAKLREYNLPKVKVFEMALGRSSGKLRFRAEGTKASARSETGDAEVVSVNLDQFLFIKPPTFLKLDIEGNELEALAGAMTLLKRDRPACAVCVYHQTGDFWRIPLFLHKSLPFHRLNLRSHAHDGFELVIYVVPQERWSQ